MSTFWHLSPSRKVKKWVMNCNMRVNGSKMAGGFKFPISGGMKIETCAF